MGPDTLCSKSLRLYDFAFRFRLVPFLTELRAVMDWVWTDTTLSLSNWICVEDIYAHIFVLKCWRESEKVRNMHLHVTTCMRLEESHINSVKWRREYTQMMQLVL